jgi:heptose-I-phosphate ethanolaminephosphotransferase
MQKWEGVKSHLHYLILPAAVFAAALTLHSDMYAGSALRAIAHVVALAILMYAIFAWTAGWRLVRGIIGVAIALEILVHVTFGSSISIIVIMSVLNTTPGEASSFVTEYALEYLLLTFFVLAVTWGPVLKHTKLNLAAAVLGVGYLVVPMLSLSDGLFSTETYLGHRQTARARVYSDTYAKFDYVVFQMSQRFSPLSWIRAIPDTIQFANLSGGTESSWGDVSAGENSPKILVIGIGESLRAANLSIYGYSRETTPRLSRRSSELDIYTHAYSAGTNTWNSLPASLTLFGARPDFGKSILRLAEDAGYKTYWLSNQTRFSTYDFSVSSIADQAGHVYFVSDEFEDDMHDEVLVPKLAEILRAAADDDNRHLVVLHFMGSHLRFHERYPESFAKFTGGSKELDRYDNSVLYTDFVQDQVLDLVQEYGGEYLFFADHGLGDPEGEYSLKHDLRPTPGAESLHVPFFTTRNEGLRISPDDTVSLFFLECIFARWAGISAPALDDADYCRSSLDRQDITFLDSSVTINTRAVAR